MKNHRTINWEETSVLDRARRQGELLLKEAQHIQMTPAVESFNQDTGLDIPGFWTTLMR